VVREGWSLVRLALATTRVCFRHRTSGLAAEAAFFALLSLPPLVLGLVGAVGYVGGYVGADVLGDLRDRLASVAGAVLAPDAVESVILPTYDEVTGRGRFDIISFGFLLSLWAGSRSLNVYLDTISIMYGLGGERGMVRTRALSFSLYVAALTLSSLTLPLVLLGPDVVVRILGRAGLAFSSDLLAGALYWAVFLPAAVAGLATLYHLATPVRTPWRKDLPGALLALLIWLGASFALRAALTASVAGTSIYGPLTAPIVVMIWLYLLSLAVLVGAALNAAADSRDPDSARSRPPEPDGDEDDETVGLARRWGILSRRAAVRSG
jgi:membrane protein